MKTMLRVMTLGLVIAVGVIAAPRPTDAGAAQPATLTGPWTITISTEQGDFDTNWDLTQHDDGTLTGDIEGRQGSSEAEGGWVKGDEFGFSVTRDFQGRSFEIEYEGTFIDDALEGTLTAGDGQFTADFTGVRAGGDDR
ncbi:MAG: hypothetical protein ACC682_12685 [Gemmatimonadota bacterium]